MTPISGAERLSHSGRRRALFDKAGQDPAVAGLPLDSFYFRAFRAYAANNHLHFLLFFVERAV